jgi:hypothetical protein
LSLTIFTNEESRPTATLSTFPACSCVIARAG